MFNVKYNISQEKIDILCKLMDKLVRRFKNKYKILDKSKGKII